MSPETYYKLEVGDTVSNYKTNQTLVMVGTNCGEPVFAEAISIDDIEEFN